MSGTGFDDNRTGFLSRPDPVYPLLWRVADNEVRSIVVGDSATFENWITSKRFRLLIITPCLMSNISFALLKIIGTSRPFCRHADVYEDSLSGGSVRMFTSHFMKIESAESVAAPR